MRGASACSSGGRTGPAELPTVNRMPAHGGQARSLASAALQDRGGGGGVK
ncbi:MAG: hypothetical protein V4724_13835 [Pseudomonadota bacterium]